MRLATSCRKGGPHDLAPLPPHVAHCPRLAQRTAPGDARGRGSSWAVGVMAAKKRFAEGTSVPATRTQGEIAALVERYGASQFSSGWMANQSAVSFAVNGRLVRFVVPMPTLEDARAQMKMPRGCWGRQYIADAAVAKWRDAEVRRLWRCLLLAIKSKLETVESGIATFDEEFLAHIVTDNQMTIIERLRVSSDGQGLLPPMEGDTP